MSTKTKVIPITAGPSKMDLMLSLFDGKEILFKGYEAGSSPRELDFRGRVNSLEREDGSGESWNIRLGKTILYYRTDARQGKVQIQI